VNVGPIHKGGGGAGEGANEAAVPSELFKTKFKKENKYYKY
jgi:hypothetical protein